MNQTVNPVLSILMPVRNEGINIKIMLKLLSAVVEVNYEVLIVYDTEDDESLTLLNDPQLDKCRVRFIHNTYGRGVIHALRTGVEHASGKYILLFAADEAGPVLAIEHMLALMAKGCDLVSCTRYKDGGRRLGGSLIGSVLSRMANFFFYHLSGAQLTDSTTGIKMFSKRAFEKVDLSSAPIGWTVAFEFAIKAQLAGLQLGEVPIVSIDRLYGGESTFRVGPWCVEYLKWFFWGIWMLRFHSNGINPNLMVLESPSLHGMGGQTPEVILRAKK